MNNLSLESFIENRDYAILNNKLYFQHNSQQIWVTDGTNTNTQQLTNTGTLNVPTSVTVFQPIVYNSEIYFDGNYPTQGVELWKITDTTLSLENIISKNRMSLYPNPTKDIINIKTKNLDINVEIYDVSGKLILKTKNTEIKVDNLTNGIYFLRLSDNNQTETHKFIKH